MLTDSMGHLYEQHRAGNDPFLPYDTSAEGQNYPGAFLLSVFT